MADQSSAEVVTLVSRKPKTFVEVAGIRSITMTSRTFTIEIENQAEFSLLDVLDFVTARVVEIGRAEIDQRSRSMAAWFDPTAEINQ